MPYLYHFQPLLPVPKNKVSIVLALTYRSIAPRYIGPEVFQLWTQLEPGYQENAALPESGCVKDIGSDLETLQSLEMAYAEAGMMRKFSERLSSQLGKQSMHSKKVPFVNAGHRTPCQG